MKLYIRQHTEARADSRRLMIHQKSGLDYCYNHRHAALLWEMRLGKTLTTIRFLASSSSYSYALSSATARPIRSILVLAPLTVLEAWERELKAEGEYAVSCYNLAPSERAERIRLVSETQAGRRWLLANYEIILSSDYICSVHFDAVICDESARLRNPAAKVTKLVRHAWRDAAHRIILTGMANPESDLDLFTQFAWLHGSFMGHYDYWSWRAKFFQKSVLGFGWVPKRGTATAIKQAVSDVAYVLRRRDAGMDCGKVREKRYVTMTPAQQKLYNSALKDFEVSFADGTEQKTNWAVVVYNWLTRITGGFDPAGNLISSAKINALVELITGELRKEKIVVWCKHTAEIEYIASILAGYGTVVQITGQTPQAERADILNRFRCEPRTLWLIAQVKCAKFGVDCSIADTAIYYSNTASCEDRVQSEDRIVHPQKTAPVLIVDLICRNTIDEETADLLATKQFKAHLFMSAFQHALLAHIKQAK